MRWWETTWGRQLCLYVARRAVPHFCVKIRSTDQPPPPPRTYTYALLFASLVRYHGNRQRCFNGILCFFHIGRSSLVKWEQWKYERNKSFYSPRVTQLSVFTKPRSYRQLCGWSHVFPFPRNRSLHSTADGQCYNLRVAATKIVMLPNARLQLQTDLKLQSFNFAAVKSTFRQRKWLPFFQR